MNTWTTQFTPINDKEWAQADYFDDAERLWKSQLPALDEWQLIETFKEGGTNLIRKWLKNKINLQRRAISNTKQEIREWRQLDAPYTDNWMVEDSIAKLEIKIKLAVKEIERISYILKTFNQKKKPQDTPGYINRHDIDRAKAVLITTFIQFSKTGFAKCLWHEEKTASMKYDKRRNRVHCFGCGLDCDVVDVIMKQQGISDFLSAIKILINKCQLITSMN